MTYENLSPFNTYSIKARASTFPMPQTRKNLLHTFDLHQSIPNAIPKLDYM